MNPNGRLTVYACENGVHYAKRLVQCLNAIIDTENEHKEGFTQHEPEVQLKVPEVTEFPSTFLKTRLPDKVRGEDAFLVQWFPAPPRDGSEYHIPSTAQDYERIIREHQGNSRIRLPRNHTEFLAAIDAVNRKTCAAYQRQVEDAEQRGKLTAPCNKEQFFQAIAALNHAGVKRLSLVTPYAYGQRKDTIEGRDSIDAALFCQELEGITHRQRMDAFCLDIHAQQIVGNYQQMNVSMVSVPMFATYLDFLKINYPDTLEGAVIILPDTGSAKRGGKISHLTGLERITMDKRRLSPTKVQMEAYSLGKVKIKGSRGILFDDILGSGGTAGEASAYLMDEQGMKEISWVMTHPEATRLSELDRLHEQGRCKYVFVADTIPVPRDYCIPFPTAPLQAQLIYNIHTDRSIGPYLEATTFLDGKLPLPKAPLDP